MPPGLREPRSAELLALAAVGGSMDAVGYLRLHVFTGNMTGNAVVSGLALGGVKPLDAGHAIVAIAAFVAGVMVGTLLRDARTALLLEILVLGVFALLWQFDRVSDWGGVAALIAIGAAAMGLQTAATRRTHGAGSSTTYMSGTLARAASDGVEALRDRTKASGALFSGATFAIYLLAALGVGTLAAHNADVVAIIPLFSLVVVFAVGLSQWREQQKNA